MPQHLCITFSPLALLWPGYSLCLGPKCRMAPSYCVYGLWGCLITTCCGLVKPDWMSTEDGNNIEMVRQYHPVPSEPEMGFGGFYVILNFLCHGSPLREEWGKIICSSLFYISLSSFLLWPPVVGGVEYIGGAELRSPPPYAASLWTGKEAGVC